VNTSTAPAVRSRSRQAQARWRAVVGDSFPQEAGIYKARKDSIPAPSRRARWFDFIADGYGANYVLKFDRTASS